MDDAQHQKFAPLSEVTSLTELLNACRDGTKTWMTENLHKLNDDKTEAPFFSFLSPLKPSTISVPDSVSLGIQTIPFSDSVSNIKLPIKKPILCYYLVLL